MAFSKTGWCGEGFAKAGDGGTRLVEPNPDELQCLPGHTDGLGGIFGIVSFVGKAAISKAVGIAGRDVALVGPHGGRGMPSGPSQWLAGTGNRLHCSGRGR